MKTKKNYLRRFISYLTLLCSLLLSLDGLALSNQSMKQAYAANADVSDFVTRLYTIILDREPDENGLSDWVERLNNGTFTGVDVSQGFILSDEFLAKDIPNEDFVKIMYRTFFDREADAPGLETWVGFLERGYMKKFIYAGFANSDEFQTICDDYGIIRGTIQLTPEEQAPAVPEGELDVSQFVKRLYSEILGRAADADGLNTWVTLLENGEYSGAQVAEGFILSEEFINTDMTDEEFVHIMYKTFFDREADEGGLATWMNALEDGYSKKFVFAGFANSTEFGTLCGEYGIEQGEVDVYGEDVIINDMEAPYITALSLNKYEVCAPGNIEISATATDNLSGVDYIGIFFVNKECNREINLNLYGNDGTLSGVLKLDEYVQTGIYEVKSIYIWDYAENERIYWSGYQTEKTEEISEHLQIYFEVK